MSAITIDVAEHVPPDLRTLAILILKGDVDAALPFSDLVMENYAHRQRVTMAYVCRLEDTIATIRLRLRTEFQQAEMFDDIAVRSEDLLAIRNELWRLEREAVGLGRHL